MIKNIKYIEKEQFNFPQFLLDIKPVLKLKDISLTDLSQHKYYKGKNYLSNALNDGRIQANILYDLADYLGIRLKDYEIPRTPYAEKKQEEQNQKPTCDAQWTCDIEVNTEFETVMVKITLPNGKPIVGRSFLYSSDDTGILQSISYAIHMCYKIIQQGKIEQISNGEVEQNKKLNFKDWITKYEDANSSYGTLARYIKSHYDKFPSSGKKNMRYYLSQNKGSAHYDAFETLFNQYLEWDRANYQS